MNTLLLKLLGGSAGWYVLAAAVLGAGVLGFGAGKVFYGASIAHLETRLAEERLATSEDRGKALLEAQGASEAASSDILGRIDRASQALARETARLPEENQRLKSLLVEVSGNDEFACRRRPLPERLLDGLRRPGRAPAADPGEDSGASPGPSVVLPAGTGEPAPELH